MSRRASRCRSKDHRVVIIHSHQRCIALAEALEQRRLLSAVISPVIDMEPIPPAGPTFSVSDAAIAEGTGIGTTAMKFFVTRSGDTSGAAEVYWATGVGTAKAGGDYTAVTPKRLRFVAGEVSKLVTVKINKDARPEPVNETLLVNLFNATGATIADGQGIGTIIDDEPRIKITARANLRADQQPSYTFTGLLASFTSPDFDAASDFSAVIDWGDGNSSAGQIVWNYSTLKWDVVASHTYSTQKTYDVQIVVTDLNGGTGSVTPKIRK